MRIRDWSSDVCSSDLLACPLLVAIDLHRELPDLGDGRDAIALVQGELWCAGALAPRQRRAWHEAVRKGGVIGGCRKSGVWGKGVSVRVELGGHRFIKKKILYK